MPELEAEDDDEDEDDEDDASAALAAAVGAGAPAEDDEEDELELELEGEGEAFATLPSFPFFLLASGLPPDVPARAASSRASMRARLAILRSSSAIRSASPAALAAAIFFSSFAIVGMVSALAGPRRRRRCRR